MYATIPSTNEMAIKQTIIIKTRPIAIPRPVCAKKSYNYYDKTIMLIALKALKPSNGIGVTAAVVGFGKAIELLLPACMT